MHPLHLVTVIVFLFYMTFNSVILPVVYFVILTVISYVGQDSGAESSAPGSQL